MKNFLTLAVLLQMVLTVSAQSIEGKWKANIKDDSGINIPCTVTFTNKGGMTLNANIKQSDPQVGTVHIALKTAGTYLVEGKELTITLNPKKSMVEVTRIDYTSTLKMAMTSQPGLETQILNTMNEQLRSEAANMVKEMPMNGKMTINEQTDKKMVLTSGKETIVLTR